MHGSSVDLLTAYSWPPAAFSLVWEVIEIAAAKTDSQLDFLREGSS